MPKKVAKAGSRNRVLKSDKIQRLLDRAGKFNMDMKKARYQVTVTDTQALVNIEGLIIAETDAAVTIRHKKSRGGSKMAVSIVPRENIVAMLGSKGKPGYVTVKTAQEIALFKKAAVKVTEGRYAIQTEDGEVFTFFANERITVKIMAEEESAPSGRGKKVSSKKAEKKPAKKTSKKSSSRRKAKQDDEFDDL